MLLYTQLEDISMLLNDQHDFERSITTLKIKNIDDKFYSEFDYIKDIENITNKLIHRKSFLSTIFPKSYEIYKTNINNRKKIEILKVIKDSNLYKIIDYLNIVKKVDFFNVEYILQDKNFLNYSIENEYIDKQKLENIREYLIDISFNKEYNDYQLLLKTQNLYKNKIDDILGI